MKNRVHGLRANSFLSELEKQLKNTTYDWINHGVHVTKEKTVYSWVSRIESMDGFIVAANEINDIVRCPADNETENNGEG